MIILWYQEIFFKLTAPRCPGIAAGAVSLIKSHDIVILSFCNLVKGQAKRLNSNSRGKPRFNKAAEQAKNKNQMLNCKGQSYRKNFWYQEVCSYSPNLQKWYYMGRIGRHFMLFLKNLLGNFEYCWVMVGSILWHVRP